MELNDIPVEQIAADLGFKFNRKQFRYELGEYRLSIAGTKTWKNAAGLNAFTSFSGPDLRGRGAIAFVQKFFGFSFRDAVDYLKKNYLSDYSTPKFVPRKKEPRGCFEVDSDIRYLKGMARTKRVVVLVDDQWHNEMSVAQEFPWARNAWVKSSEEKRSGLLEFTTVDSTNTVISVIPLKRGAELLIEVLRRSRREGSSVHIRDSGACIQVLRSEAAKYCPVYLYREQPKKIVPLPPVDERLWEEVRTYLVCERGIERSIVDDCHARGYIFATRGWWEGDEEKERFVDLGAAAVFATRNETGKPTGAVVRGVRNGFFLNKRSLGGMDRNAGFYWRYVRGENLDAKPLLVIVESPIEALSLESLAILEGRPYSNTLFSAKGGAGGDRPFLVRIASVLAKGGSVVISFNADEKAAGEIMMRKLAAPFEKEVEDGRIRLQVPKSANDWNDVLKSKRLR